MPSNPAQRGRVFVDSSVLISASISKSGYARDLIFAGMDRWVQKGASTYVLGETRRNLARTSPGAVAFFEMFLKPEILESINPASSLVQHVAHQVEPKDAAIIAGAIASECPAIATFDRRHLLAEAELIHREWAIRVEMPGDILQRLSLLRGEE